MMASHRPSDPAPEPVPPQPTPVTVGPTTLPPSPFLTGFDLVLALGVLALGFLLASFSIRNTDFWMNAAAGRLIMDGKYSFGKDPFSFVDPERTWVNHAWLFDIGLYWIFKAAGGPGVVVMKASAIAILAALLLWLRKPGQAMWPGVVCVGIALIAAAPRFSVQPVLASYFFFTGLLYLLLRMPRSNTSWRFPVCVGVLFWLWANCDQWFFVGPLTLLLYTAAQYIRKDENENLNTLWKALAIGVVACMLNPHHVRVWALPPELVNSSMAELVANDTDYNLMFQGAFSKGAVDFSIGADRDNPANTYALAFLIIATLIGVALNYRQMSLGLLAVWLLTFVLWLLHLRVVPFLAFASAACAAANFAAFGQRLSARTFNDGTVRVLHMLRTFGRGGTAIVGLLLIALTYPGWLHPLNQQRRWKWDIEPNESMISAAKKLQEWHDAGTLPPEAHVLNLQPDFAGYLAWYAPGVKSYCDYRFAYHEPEMRDYVDLKKYLNLSNDAAKQSELGFDFADFLRKNQIVYAVATHGSRQRNRELFATLMRPNRPNQAEPDWTLLNIDGRGLILAWNLQTVVPKTQIDALKFDPVKLAFTNVTPLKKIENPQGPMPERDIWDRFVFAPPPSPMAGDEVDIYLAYRNRVMNELANKIYKEVAPTDYRPWDALRIAYRQMTQVGQLPPSTFAWFNIRPDEMANVRVKQLIEERTPAEAHALALLSVRAARKAIAQSPNHPDGYYFLYDAYSSAQALDVMGLHPLVSSATLARHITRISRTPQQRRSTLPVFLSAYALEKEHFNARPPRIDMQLAVARLSVAYLEYEVQLRDEEYDRLSKEERDQTEAMRRELEQKSKRIQVGEEEVQKERDRYIINVAQLSVPVLRAAEARRYGLAQEALDELLKELERYNAQGEQKLPLPRERAQIFAAYAEAIELLLVAGRAEDAVVLLEQVDRPEIESELRRPEIVSEYYMVRRDVARRKGLEMPYDHNPLMQFRFLRHWAGMVVGDFPSVEALLEQSLTGVRQDFNTLRQQLLGTATAIDPKYDAAQLHQHIILMAKYKYLLQYAMIVRGPGFYLSEHPGQVPVFLTVTNVHVDRYMAALRELGETHVRLALVYLEEGDTTAAKFHFDEAVKLPALSKESRSLRLAKSYLEVLPKSPREQP